jgi:hypothetical protein
VAFKQQWLRVSFSVPIVYALLQNNAYKDSTTLMSPDAFTNALQTLLRNSAEAETFGRQVEFFLTKSVKPGAGTNASTSQQFLPRDLSENERSAAVASCFIAAPTGATPGTPASTASILRTLCTLPLSLFIDIMHTACFGKPTCAESRRAYTKIVHKTCMNTKTRIDVEDLTDMLGCLNCECNDKGVARGVERAVKRIAASTTSIAHQMTERTLASFFKQRADVVAEVRASAASQTTSQTSTVVVESRKRKRNDAKKVKSVAPGFGFSRSDLLWNVIDGNMPRRSGANTARSPFNRCKDGSIDVNNLSRAGVYAENEWLLAHLTRWVMLHLLARWALNNGLDFLPEGAASVLSALDAERQARAAAQATAPETMILQEDGLDHNFADVLDPNLADVLDPNLADVLDHNLADMLDPDTNCTTTTTTVPPKQVSIVDKEEFSQSAGHEHDRGHDHGHDHWHDRGYAGVVYTSTHGRNIGLHGIFSYSGGGGGGGGSCDCNDLFCDRH